MEKIEWMVGKKLMVVRENLCMETVWIGEKLGMLQF